MGGWKQRKRKNKLIKTVHTFIFSHLCVVTYLCLKSSNLKIQDLKKEKKTLF